MGFNAVTIHQGCELNPFINYPFSPNVTARLSEYTAERHKAGVAVQLYYTVRELSNRASELPVLRSLGTEILVSETTRAASDPAAVATAVDRGDFKVKGREATVRVWEL